MRSACSQRKRAHLGNQTVRVESMLTREDVELPRKQRVVACRAVLGGFNRHKAFAESPNVLLDSIGAASRLVHLVLESIDATGVALECGTDLFFEIIDNDKVGEEWQNVFDREQVGAIKEPHRAVKTEWSRETYM